MSFDASLADKLVSRLENNSFQDKGVDLDQLADEMRRGYPVTRLSNAIRSKNIETVEAALWVATETGRRSVALIGLLPEIVDLPSNEVKYRISEVCLYAIPEDDRLVPAISKYLVFEPWFVRWGAIAVFLAMPERMFAKETWRLLHQHMRHANEEETNRLLTTMWLLNVLRSNLSLEEKEYFVRECEGLSDDQIDTIVNLTLRRLSKLAKKAQNEFDWSKILDAGK